jgi:Protein of unknown function (DUF2934)
MSTNKKTQKDAGPNGRTMDDRTMDDAVPRYEPAIEEIQVRAYEIYVQRGRIDGFDLEHWLQAEEELKQNSNKPTDA